MDGDQSHAATAAATLFSFCVDGVARSVFCMQGLLPRGSYVAAVGCCCWLLLLDGWRGVDGGLRSLFAGNGKQVGWEVPTTR